MLIRPRCRTVFFPCYYYSLDFNTPPSPLFLPQAVKRRDAVKDKADERRQMFHNSLAYQQFKADADDFARWMAEKQKLADDESYRDLNNLERKLQKHEAFQLELHSNEGQLRVLNHTGEELIAMDHYRKDDIADTLDQLSKSWQKVSSHPSEETHTRRNVWVVLTRIFGVFGFLSENEYTFFS